MNENEVRLEVAAASQQWIAHFNAGDFQACADSYVEKAVMEATPLGCYEGRDAIARFWQSLVADGYANLAYQNVEIQVLGINIALLSADWSMNLARGHISQELWLKSPQGQWQLAKDEFAVLEQKTGEAA